MKSGDRLEPGAIIDGRYRLISPIGSGATGAVWLAEDKEHLAMQIALKLLHPTLVHHRPALERWAREAEILARLDHPSIARPLRLGLDVERPYIALEYVDGKTLASELASRSASARYFPDEELGRVFVELCLAVAYAHEKGVVHRDLKPLNVMLLERAGALYVKVLDLGLAKLIEAAQSDATTRGRRLGSLYYMSPEQGAGEPAGPASDVFSLGVILFELLTLRRAFAVDTRGEPLAAHLPVPPDPANTPVSVLSRIATGARHVPSTVRPGIAAGLDALVLSALSVRPEDRPASALVLAGELERCLRAEPARDEAPAVRRFPSRFASPVTEPSAPTESEEELSTVRTEAPEAEEVLLPTATAPRIAAPIRTAAATTAQGRKPGVLAILALVLPAAAILGGLALAWPEPRAPQQGAQAEATPPPAPRAVRAEPEREAEPDPGPEPSPAVQPDAATARPEALPRAIRQNNRDAGSSRSEPRSDPRADPPVDPLRALLDRARAEPGEPRHLIALSEAIHQAAARLDDPATRARVRRLATSGAMAGDLEALAGALDVLERAREAESKR